MDAGDHRSFLDLAELERREVVPVKATKAMRLLHGAVPLERKFCVLLRRYRNHTGLLSVPWGDFQLHFPSSWLNDVCDAVYKTPHSNQPEFFELIAPLIPNLKRGSIVMSARPSVLIFST